MSDKASTTSPPRADERATAPDPSVALSALRWARDVADSGVLGTVVEASASDFLAIPQADVRRELDALLVGPHPEPALDALLLSGALETLLPEVHALVGFGDGEWRHKDVWKHTKQVVRQAVPRLVVRWSALLHDIGKVKTRSVDDRGRIHFFGHSEVGASMFRRRVIRRVSFDHTMAERIHWLVLHHLRPGQYDPSWTDSAVRRFGKELEDGLDDLLCLSRADITTKRPEKRKRGLHQISELGLRIDKIRELDARVPPLPSGLGDVIQRHFDIPPSRLIGDIKRRLERMIEVGVLEAHRDADYYVSLLAEQKAAFGLTSSSDGPDEAVVERLAEHPPTAELNEAAHPEHDTARDEEDENDDEPKLDGDCC